jgi:hypothetical protein
LIRDDSNPVFLRSFRCYCMFLCALNQALVTRGAVAAMTWACPENQRLRKREIFRTRVAGTFQPRSLAKRSEGAQPTTLSSRLVIDPCTNRRRSGRGCERLIPHTDRSRDCRTPCLVETLAYGANSTSVVTRSRQLVTGVGHWGGSGSLHGLNWGSHRDCGGPLSAAWPGEKVSRVGAARDSIHL